MGTVLKEVIGTKGDIKSETIYVHVQIELTNKYRIKTNPTIMFLNGSDVEIYRVEGFHETNEILGLINDLDEKHITLKTIYDENSETREDYIINLYQDESVSPIEVIYVNKTGVFAPRITVINLLIQAQKEGYINPFPSFSVLEAVQFNGDNGVVSLKLPDKTISSVDIERMRRLLEKTLSNFGVCSAQLKLTD
ncbi:hypothetical protein [Paenibacillus peoriae]|uniref:hypothetical protein n=1 Tax=Paenibacillus peoriae TaxID=59893 RepID=UPI00215AE972|nr:hypothetical protein [Paenibacillus peoriae]